MLVSSASVNLYSEVSRFSHIGVSLYSDDKGKSNDSVGLNSYDLKLINAKLAFI